MMAPNQCSYFIIEFYFLDYYEKPAYKKLHVKYFLKFIILQIVV